MPDPLDGLTLAQREIVAHRGGPLVVVGAAGTGKTRTLLHRHAWLATAGGLAPEQVLALTASEAAADAFRAGVEDELERGFEELAVHTVHGFAARLLRDEALEAGLDPFVVPVAPGHSARKSPMFFVAAPRKRWIDWSSSAAAVTPPCPATSRRRSRPWAKLASCSSSTSTWRWRRARRARTCGFSRSSRKACRTRSPKSSVPVSDSIRSCAS